MDHWTEEQIAALDAIETFERLAEIALAVLQLLREERTPIVIISGPITTGGCGSVSENRARLARSIEIARANGCLVFNQLPFEIAIRRISAAQGVTDHTRENYCHDILEVFYRRIFESGMLSKAFFLPGWKKSVGASREREFCRMFGLPAHAYPARWLQ